MAAVPRDLEGALMDLGIMPTKTDDDEVWAHCPEHMRWKGREDRSASWSVNRRTGWTNCFSCPSQGTFLGMAMEMRFPHDVFAAMRWMREFGLNLDSAADLPTYAEISVPAEPAEIVPETRLAMYDPVPPTWALEKRRVSLEAVQHYGVRWDPEHESWIIPVRYPDGSLAGWQEKWERQRRFINWPKGLAKSQCLFGLDAFPVGEPAILLESPLDVLVLYTAGVTGGLSTYGATWSLRQMAIVLSVTDELVEALDNDSAGREHAEILRNGKHDRGKLVQPGYATRIYMRHFDYGRTGQKDIGDMEHSDIHKGLREARHSSLVDFANEEQRKNRRVYRDIKDLPGKARSSNGGSRAVPANSRSRHRKNSSDYRSRGGTGR
jgi:hypothetical protein